MSTAEILSLVSLISYILAGICLVLVVLFWVVFKIPVIIGDLSGRTARKSIEKMRQANVRTGNKSYRASATNVARGKLTDTMHSPKKEKVPETVTEAGRPETGLLAENKAPTQYSDETVALDAEEATGMLLDEDVTTVLNAEPAEKRTGGKKLTILEEVMLIHTDEVI